MRLVDMAFAVTVGAGKNRPQGERAPLATDVSPARALKALLDGLPPQTFGWWSPHTFCAGLARNKDGELVARPDSYRHGDLWEASVGVSIDADNLEHAAWDDASRAALLDAIVNDGIPGAFCHPTTHGLRIAFLLDTRTTDAEAWARAADGAVSLTEAAFAKIPGLRIEVDRGATLDRARCFWAPNAIVDGEPRNGTIHFMRDRVWSLEELAAHANGSGPKKPEPIAGGIEHPKRHKSCTSFAASLRARGETPEAIYHALVVFNETYCRPPKPDSELLAIARWTGAKAPGPPEDRRPLIRLRVELHEVVAEAVAALQAAGTPIYSHGGRLIQVARGEPAGRKAKVPAGVASLKRVSPEWLQVKLAEAARWARFSSKGDEWSPTTAPLQIAKAVLSLGEWPFPEITMVTDSPYIAPNGRTVTETGLDQETGIVLQGVHPRIEVLGNPVERLVEAVIAIGDAFSSFPFADRDVDWPATFAAILTCVGRASVDDPVPGFGISSPVPQSGKGMIARSISALATGRECVEFPGDLGREELRKTLIMIASRGYPIVSFDNLEFVVRSGSLASVLTSRFPTARLLGKNDEDVGGPWVTVLFLTGVGLRYGGDIAYRMITINLDPKAERPDLIPYSRDPVAHVLANRAGLHRAALEILTAHRAAGSPRHGGARMGRYREWDDKIRSAVIWAGVGDPIKSRERALREADDDAEVRERLFAAWHDLFGDEPRTVSDAIDQAQGIGDSEKGLREAIAALDPKGEGKLSPRAVGELFKRSKGRIVGKLRLEVAGVLHSATEWRIASPAGAREEVTPDA